MWGDVKELMPSITAILWSFLCLSLFLSISMAAHDLRRKPMKDPCNQQDQKVEY